MKKFLAGILIALASQSAFAWGSFEQGVLSGIVGTVIIQEVTKPRQQTQQPQTVYVQPQQQVIIVQQPQPVYPVCYGEPLYDSRGLYVTTINRCR